MLLITGNYARANLKAPMFVVLVTGRARLSPRELRTDRPQETYGYHHH